MRAETVGAGAGVPPATLYQQNPLAVYSNSRPGY